MSHHPCKQKHLFSKYGTPHKSKWYINKKRRLRQKMAVSLRWRIQNDNDSYGAFRSDQYIQGCPSWNEATGGIKGDEQLSSWADIVFMSNKDIRQGIFYNAVINTVADEIVKDIEDEVYEEAEALLEGLTFEEREDVHGRISFKKLPNSNYSEMIHEPSKVLPAFDNKTIHGYKAKLLREKLKTLSSRDAYISCKKDYAYVYGVGLHMTTSAVGINFSSILEAIDNFRNHNEKNFKEKTNIKPHLPAIKVKILMSIHTHEIMDAKSRGLEKPKFDDKQLTEEEKRHYHVDSAALKPF